MEKTELFFSLYTQKVCTPSNCLTENEFGVQKQYCLITRHRGLTLTGNQLGGQNSFSLSQFTSVRNTAVENQSLYWWCSEKVIISLEQTAVSSHVIFSNLQKQHYISELYYSASFPNLSSKISSQSARTFCSLAALLNDQQSRWLSYITNLAFWLWVFNYSQLILLFFDPLLLVFCQTRSQSDSHSTQQEPFH